MDYKYIEQLIDRYWECETTIEEEQILRTFFMQEKLPAHLLRYRAYFSYLKEAQKIGVSADFEERLRKEMERPVVQAKRISLLYRFSPLLKAAAVLLLVFSMGSLVKHSMIDTTVEPMIGQVEDTIQEKIDQPQVAYQGDTVQLLKEDAVAPFLEKEID